MLTRIKVGSMKELMTASDLDDAACQEGINEDDEYMVRKCKVVPHLAVGTISSLTHIQILFSLTPVVLLHK